VIGSCGQPIPDKTPDVEVCLLDESPELRSLVPALDPSDQLRQGLTARVWYITFALPDIGPGLAFLVLLAAAVDHVVGGIR